MPNLPLTVLSAVILSMLIILSIININNFNNISQVFAVPGSNVEPKNMYCSKDELSDNFEGSTYILEESRKSPNGKWQNIYLGNGSGGVMSNKENNEFFLSPGISRSINETNAGLVNSTGTYCNFVLEIDVKTVKPLREDNPPNTWEVAWVFFRYTDTFHYYWIVVKPNGVELGKKDCDTCSDPVDGQHYLETSENPILKVGKWSHWKVEMNGNHIKITVDGKKAIDFTDTEMSPKLASGSIAMYTEDAFVKFDNIVLNPK